MFLILTYNLHLVKKKLWHSSYLCFSNIPTPFDISFKNKPALFNQHYIYPIFIHPYLTSVGWGIPTNFTYESKINWEWKLWCRPNQKVNFWAEQKMTENISIHIRKCNRLWTSKKILLRTSWTSQRSQKIFAFIMQASHCELCEKSFDAKFVETLG